MAMSMDVKLPKSVAPRFPDRCVRCLMEGPRRVIRLASQSIVWWTWFIGSRRFRVDVPCCDSCHIKIRSQRWLRAGITTAVALAAGYFGFEYIADLARPLRRWAFMGLALLALSPIIGWEVFFPPPVDITAGADTVDYEFKDKRYALEFALLNGTKVQE